MGHVKAGRAAPAVSRHHQSGGALRIPGNHAVRGGTAKDGRVVPLAPMTRFRRYLYQLIAKYLSFFTTDGARMLEVGSSSRMLRDVMGGVRTMAYRPVPDAGFVATEVL